MAEFPDDLGAWLTTYDDAPKFSTATQEEVDAFKAEGWDVPDSLESLWLDYGSCYFDGDAWVDKTTFRISGIHGLDDTEHGIHAVWRKHPELLRERLLPVAADDKGNEIVWSGKDQRVYAVAYDPPSDQRGVFGASLDELWDRVGVQSKDKDKATKRNGDANYPATDMEPLGEVDEATITRAFSNYLVFVLDTDEGKPAKSALDERGLAETSTCVTVGTWDDEVSVTLARAEKLLEPTKLKLIWDGTLESPTREIGIMDASGLIPMYVKAAAKERVRIYGDTETSPRSITVLVGEQAPIA